MGTTSKKYSRWTKGLLLCAVMIAGILCLTACNPGGEKPLTAPPETEPTEPVAVIETALVDLEFPEALMPNVRHLEVSEGIITMEVFYMVSQSGERELYRIIFGDGSMGDQLGYLTVDGAEIPVTYTISEYEDGFGSEEENALYYGLMDAFSTLMDSLSKDPRFSETKYVAPVGSRVEKLKYWTLTLPENVQCEQSGQGDGYKAEFFGVVNGTRIPLYTLRLGGEVNPEDILGGFTVDGKLLDLAVEVYDISVYESWAEEDQRVIYVMMESVNEVVWQLMEDKNFSAGE